MTTDTFGRLCLTQFGKSVPDGSWARMFSELLIGMPGWYSSRCALTWKLKVTGSNRSYFQLAASTLPTADTEPSLLPTVTTTNASQGLQSTNNAGKPLLPMAAIMMPTPTSQDFKRRGPNSHQQGLPEFVRGLLPTPIASCANAGTEKERTDGISRRSQLNHLISQELGKASQLNPLFVEEMMGFPSGWILLPFLRESPLQNEQSRSIDGEVNP